LGHDVRGEVGIAVRRPSLAALEPGNGRAGGDRNGSYGRPAQRYKLEDALLDRESHDVRDDHWKISVVQSPFCRRTSCARAGPSGRSWKSAKKSGSISIPPLGSQSTLSSQACISG